MLHLGGGGGGVAFKFQAPQTPTNTAVEENLSPLDVASMYSSMRATMMSKNVASTTSGFVLCSSDSIIVRDGVCFLMM
jgi:hypothetical protein